ncbi:BamA/TamA family outer membrane protein [uncultured Desulfovibrio sp.]|uniref:autotransporter assembly complex protein TamA n=1 Tax=uncultured Desulfovibrio sp. TaxID=167968 RepID=UPI002619C4A3|nr:BamA/TamA family outer membrane protein [uncultured Desulfovibrio sp.]
MGSTGPQRHALWGVRAVRCGRAALLLALLLCAGGCGLLGKGGGEEPPQAPTPEAEADAAWQGGEPVAYTTAIRVDGGPGELADRMRSLSSLARLAKEPPDSLLALERRARADVKSATSLLHSQCYYDGTAQFSMDENARPVAVTLTLAPGRRYSLGRADVYYETDPVVPEFFRNRRREVGFWGLETEAVPPPSFPRTLPGVTVGKPVIADDLLAAVEALPESLRRQGYPLAEVAEVSYTLNREAALLNADILMRSGPPAMMGRIEVRGAKEVNADYVRRLAPWNPDEEPWNADTVEDYANRLRALGLFRTVEAKPLTEALRPDARDGAASLPLELAVTEAPMRSVGAGARYDTDTGFGVEGSWEHRNLFHNGEKLRLTAPVATETQGLKAAFEKPAFLSREQRLLLDASALHENTSAYESMAVSASGDIERRLSRFWWGSVGLGGESGSIKDNEHSEKAYGFFGPRAGVRRDTRNNVLNPSGGTQLAVNVKPYTGFYGESFTVFTGTVAASGYYAPFRKDGKPDDKLVLAGRVEAGMLTGAGLHGIPAALRYYTGGAGSVRGYAYQSLGPRDTSDDPLGGRSYQLVNLEARYKITDDVGIVPFLDGGMVYRDELPQIIGDMNWGAGLGLRYYTPIGPVRLDVGVPLQPIDGDPPLQIYVSIGQAF